MTRTRATLTAVAVLALLTACAGSGGTTPSSSGPSGGSPSVDQPSASSTATGSPGPVPTTLQALQLCVTTLGYAAGAIAGEPSDQMDTFEKAIASARSKATPTEAALADQAGVVLAAVESRDTAAIKAAGQRMSDLCGGG